MLQKIIGQFTRDVRLYNDEKIQNLASRLPSENSPDGQRMIMYMLLFSWYTRNTISPFTNDQIVSLVNSIIDVYYNREYQQMNNMMISLIRNDLQKMSFWNNEYIFKTFFNDGFIKESDNRMYVNLEQLSIFNQWILQDCNNVEFYNYSHLLVQKCNKLQYIHNYTIIISDEVPQNVVQTHCPKCQTNDQISKDDFLKMCKNYEKQYPKFSQGMKIYCHKCNTQINSIRLYGKVKTKIGSKYEHQIE